MGCSPWGREESGMTEWLHFYFSLSCTEEGNGNPLQCSCLENPMDGEAWWAAVYGVAQSWTQLKRLSSSSSTEYIYFVLFTCPALSKGWKNPQRNVSHSNPCTFTLWWSCNANHGNTVPTAIQQALENIQHYVFKCILTGVLIVKVGVEGILSFKLNHIGCQPLQDPGSHACFGNQKFYDFSWC